ncbi:hypothetical protein EMPG_12461, partial [Blastomyces silverae]
TDNLLFRESISNFEKTVIMSRDMNNIIEISDTEKENDSTNTLMKRISTSLKYKTLSLSVLKPAKCIQISERSVISTSEKIIKEI